MVGRRDMSGVDAAMAAKALDRALGCAAEYQRLVEAGRNAEADQVRTTIENLVGVYEDGKFVIPNEVRRAMGLTWTERSARQRKIIQLTLSDEAREALDELAAEGDTSRSALIEEMILRRAKRAR